MHFEKFQRWPKARFISFFQSDKIHYRPLFAFTWAIFGKPDKIKFLCIGSKVQR